MTMIMVEVPEDMAKKFNNKKIVQIKDILDYQDNLKYTFEDEKVTLNELSDFLGKTIADKKMKVC